MASAEKESIISFETAKLAKEKGLDVVTKSYYLYDKSNDTIEVRDGILGHWNIDESLDNDRMLFSYSITSQSLLQKWLRERFNIFIVILHDTEGQDTFEILFTNNVGVEIYPYITTDTNVYEDVLEIGLFNALKQI